MSTALGLARRVPRKLAVAVMWLWVLFGVFIYVWVILGSVKTNKEIFIVPWVFQRSRCSGATSRPPGRQANSERRSSTRSSSSAFLPV
jgi:hypothetical protein